MDMEEEKNKRKKKSRLGRDRVRGMRQKGEEKAAHNHEESKREKQPNVGGKGFLKIQNNVATAKRASSKGKHPEKVAI